MIRSFAMLRQGEWKLKIESGNQFKCIGPE